MRIAYLGIAGILLSSGAFSSTVSYTVTSSGDTLPYGTFSSGKGDLRGCLFNINKSGTANDYVISFDSSISTIELGGILPPLGLNQTPTSITIDGSGGSSGTVTINGQGEHPGFFAYSKPITFKNLNIANTVSEGGSGSGGALGAGGAVFVGQTASVTLENVSITESEAVGGSRGQWGIWKSG